MDDSKHISIENKLKNIFTKDDPFDSLTQYFGEGICVDIRAKSFATKMKSLQSYLLKNSSEKVLIIIDDLRNSNKILHKTEITSTENLASMILKNVTVGLGTTQTSIIPKNVNDLYVLDHALKWSFAICHHSQMHLYGDKCLLNGIKNIFD